MSDPAALIDKIRTINQANRWYRCDTCGFETTGTLLHLAATAHDHPQHCTNREHATPANDA